MKTLAIILAASSLALGGGSDAEARAPDTTTLRIDSFHGGTLDVDVFSRPAGLRLSSAPGDSARSTLRVRTPATLVVGDSVGWLRIKVVGDGAVRFSFDTDTAAHARRAPLWGRDVALRRVAGRFLPITQIIPLYP